jgi:cell division protein FtsL
VLRFTNICLGAAVFATAVWLYHVKYDVLASVRRIDALERQIDEVEHDVTLLKAEWTYLNRPERLQALAENHLELTATGRDQIITEAGIDLTIPLREIAEIPADAEDPIGDILGGLR